METGTPGSYYLGAGLLSRLALEGKKETKTKKTRYKFRKLQARTQYWWQERKSTLTRNKSLSASTPHPPGGPRGPGLPASRHRVGGTRCARAGRTHPPAHAPLLPSEPREGPQRAGVNPPTRPLPPAISACAKALGRGGGRGRR